MVECIEAARPAHAGEAEHRQRADMRLTKPRLQSAGQRRVGEQRIEVDRRLGDGDQMCTRRDRAVQEDQRLSIVQRSNIEHYDSDEVETTLPFGVKKTRKNN